MEQSSFVALAQFVWKMGVRNKIGTEKENTKTANVVMGNIQLILKNDHYEINYLFYKKAQADYYFTQILSL
ncbi:hypothetical protein [Acinetobacter sp. ANC 4862]|jgi:hypothetical protein|uniref:hypothetical protein n=1 Tax=Acinetobacter sp. ANC 4862 TaxID=2529849 RepID=UPI0010407782|nr:hypothetical protein [Acinetobacter sp. ANC 4862]TCH61178.1 hypothetical protein E0409_15230 [Acinetobacter sp. ANC 4862]